MSDLVGQFESFTELLQYRAKHQADKLAFRLLPDGDIITNPPEVTFQQLDYQARTIAESLLKTCQPGDRALLIYPSGIDFVAAFFGCLYAGVIAVPAYPPKRNQKLERLQTLVEDCQAAIALTDSHSYQIAQPQFEAVDELQHLPWLRTDVDVPDINIDNPTEALKAAIAAITGETIAFLQYTSGSTGNPKGVMVSHGNLVSNSESIYVAFEHTEESSFVGWVPLFHDLGLIGNVLQPVFAGIPCTLIPPAAFLQRPMRWLEAIHEYRGTTSGGPNFSYDLCVQTAKEDDLNRLDLSCWTIAFSGAEPIRYESVKAFSEKFACTGFEDSAHTPCFGMAETTLMITAIKKGSADYVRYFDSELLLEDTAVIVNKDHENAATWINCGYPYLDHEIKIANPTTKESCKENQVGEIWASGGSVTKGYWQKPEITDETFGAFTTDTCEGPYLRTGDLGFLNNGQLFVTGRIKDVLIIRGLNHYPQDVELTAFESHEALMPNGAAAFTIVESNEEKLVIVLEVKRTYLRKLDVNEVVMAIQKAVALNHEIQAHSIVLIKPGRLSKTSSGKVQRQKNKQMYLNDEIEAIAKIVKTETPSLDDLPVLSKARWQETIDTQSEEKKAVLGEFLQKLFSAFTNISLTEIDADAPFVGYGLDSLALTQISAYISEQLALDISVEQLFIYETLNQLTEQILVLDQRADLERQTIPHIESDSSEVNRYPLSYAQQRMWFLSQYDNSTLYNIAGMVDISGDLQIEALTEAFKVLVQRHESLRTHFETEGDKVYQIVQDTVDWKLSVVDLSDRSEQEIKDTISTQMDKVFDLTGETLFHVNLYKVAKNQYQLALSIHHIIADGWSISVLLKELSELYGSLFENKEIALEEIAAHYKDYAAWQKQFLEQVHRGEHSILDKQSVYWKKQLADVEPLELPLDKIRPSNLSYDGDRVELSFNSGLTQELKRLSQENNVTLYMTLLGAFATLLQKYTGQNDICIGSPIAARSRRELKNLIGFFVNTLVLRADLSSNPSFSNLLSHVKNTAVASFANQDIPFDKVVDVVQPERNSAITPLFQVMFVLQDNASVSVEIPGVETSNIKPYSQNSKFDITLELVEGTDGLVGHFEYKTALFNRSTIEQMGEHLNTVLEAVVRDSNISIGDISVIDEKEKHQQLILWNKTEQIFEPVNKLHELFKQQCQKTPNATAAVFDTDKGYTEITYCELDQRSNQLANYLLDQGVVTSRPNNVIGLCTDRSPEMLVGMLGILKAGAAYLPLDPNYPEERLTYMVKQSQASQLLLQSHLLPIFEDSLNSLGSSEHRDISLVALDAQWESDIAKHSISDPDVSIEPANLAYVIYTSGSTGLPKGVAISHSAICNQMHWVLNQFPMTADDKVLHKTPFSFDASIWEIWAPLLSDAQLFMARVGGHKDVKYLLDTLINQGISIVQMVPSLLQTLLALPDTANINKLKRIFLGGEALTTELALYAAELAPSVINLYGPSECTINSTFHEMNLESLEEALDESSPSYDQYHGRYKGYVTIGQPVANMQCFVLDQNQKPVPTGAVGELYIGGAGIATGYLHQEALTAEKFIPNPLVDDAGYIYRTGDLVRYLPDGNLEFLGRLDDQIKIRGFRIELGEIESVLLHHEKIQECVVAAKTDFQGNDRLVAYYVSDENILGSELEAVLSAQLADYMVPSFFIRIEFLPTNQSGKVNRKALPEPDYSENIAYVPPQNDTEEQLIEHWQNLLGIEGIGRDNNFFKLGGHSLLAARLNLQIRETFNVDLPLRTIFETQTVSRLAYEIESCISGGNAEITGALHLITQDIAPAPTDGNNPLSRPLSYAQQRLWIVDQFESASSQYNMPAAVHLQGALDKDKLETAFREVIQRHEVLRTVYREANGSPYQLVITDYEFVLQEISLGKDLNSPEGKKELEKLTQDEALKSFDLSSDLMIRASLVVGDETTGSPNSHTESVLLITLHHIASDGWSTAILVNELSHIYNSLVAGELTVLPTLPCQYVDYAHWQRQYVTESSLAEALAFWDKSLQNLPVIHSLPLDRPRLEEPTHNGGAHSQVLTTETSKAIAQLASQTDATVFMLLHAALACFIGRYSGQTDVVIGTPIANRTPASVENLIGLFVNTLVLRSDLSDVSNFKQLITQSKNYLLSAYEASQVPFEMLVDQLRPERSASYNPLFQIMLVMQNNEVGELQFSGIDECSLEESQVKTKFDLTLNASETDEGIILNWEYASDLFDHSTVEAMAESFETLLLAMIKEPGRDLNILPLLSYEKQHQLLCKNSFVEDVIDSDFDLTNSCIHQIFEKQVKKTPDNIAVVYQGESLTYQELNTKANRLANYLLSTISPVTLRKGNLIGLCVDRSIDMLVSMLGILKTGCAYVPVDPSYPKARIDHILQDSGVSFVITQTHLLDVIDFSDQFALCIDSVAVSHALEESDVENIPCQFIVDKGSELGGQDTAYVIYTSGSTGKPKGSLLMHSGLCNLARAQQQAFHVEPESRVLQFASIAFDAATSEVFMALCIGAAVHLIPKSLTQSTDELTDYVESESITHITLPPALLPLLEVQRWQSVQDMVVAGEHCPLNIAKVWSDGRRFYNAYGPSECTVCASIGEITPDNDVIHMGKPMAGVQLFVLDDSLQLVPEGVAGQLYVGGRGVGKGYLNRPELNEEKFIPSPYSRDPNAKIYATGDLVRWLSDGNLEFLGRIDHQVKIRGFRVELGEIETELAKQPSIQDCVVLPISDDQGNQQLVAYYVTNSDLTDDTRLQLSSISVDDIRIALADSLPNYMVPAFYIALDEFPLTPNGKLDRKALPQPDSSSRVSTEYVAARNETDERLIQIWSDVLHLDEIGIHHNFFEIGGHSLLAIQVIARIREAFSIELKVADLFIHSRLVSLSNKISETLAAGAPTVADRPAITPVRKSQSEGELIPLSLEQQAYWFLYQLEEGSSTYNTPAALRLMGDVNIDALSRALTTIVQRHESLRTQFVLQDGRPFQRVVAKDDIDFGLDIVTASDLRDRKTLIRQVEADADYVFNLEEELPIRARLLVIDPEDYVITLVMHHTVADGWSMDVLIRELEALYQAYDNNQENPLTSLPVQYGDYALWQKDYVQGEGYTQQVEYWKDNLKGLSSMLDLPTDYPRPPVQSYRGGEVSFVMPFKLTESLSQYSREHNTTLFNTLLAGLNVLLSRYGRTNDIAIGTAVANRSQTELEHLIGCFANTLVIRSKVDSTDSFDSLTQHITQQAFAAYENADVPFDTVVEAVQPERSLGVPPIFQVMFRLHNHAAERGVSLKKLQTERVDFEANSAKLDLNFSLIENNGCLEGVIEYATDLFTEATVMRIARHFQKVLESAMDNSQLPLNNLQLLSQSELEQVNEWNNTLADYPMDECLHHLVERTVERVPNKTAYVWGDKEITYQELNQFANKLAHYLMAKGIGPEKAVGMSVHRSFWAGISILATMKSGGTYVPLDANYPRDRILHMLNIAQPSIILTISSLKDKFVDFDGEIICLDEVWQEIEALPDSNPPHIGADHSAYILFTSGSTGKPKGILVSHHSFRNMAVSQEKLGLMDEESRVLQFASLSFSISFWGTFMAWTSGGILYGVTEDEALPGEPLYDLLNSAQITHVTWPVSLLTTIPIERVPLSLQTVISSAEPCTDAVVERWTKRGCRFLNLYGNSEVSLGSTMYEYHSVGQKLTIGKPLPNTKMYLLDENLNQVPVGVIAEIHTAGVGLARGYVNNPEETAKQFIDSPFNADVFFEGDTPRLYKTGDLGRYLPNGEIEFIGRDDYQVSIRGFRVELTEIETVLRHLYVIEEVVVVIRPDSQGVARLVCFYVLQEGVDQPSRAQLNSRVSEKLPSYMVPSLFIRLDEMPLTPNRKIDRLGLPEATFDQQTTDEYIAPEGELEIALSSIWADVLEIDSISSGSSFFELGGHSLLAVQVVTRIKEQLSLSMSVKDIFTHNTIHSLAEKLAAQVSEDTEVLPAIAERDQSVWYNENRYLPLSLEQAPYWFLYQLEGGSATYNIPVAMRLQGDLDSAALERAFKVLIERHETLRTVFVGSEGKPCQQILNNWLFELPVEAVIESDQTSDLQKQIRSDASYIFDLANELPIRVKLYQVNDKDYLLTVVVHHTVIDGWSLDILVNELATVYRLIVSGDEEFVLPELEIQYGDYAVWQQEHVVGPYYDNQITYWKEQLAGLAPVLNLPTDYTRPPIQSYKGSEVAVNVPYALTTELKLFAAQNGTTLFNVLVAGLAIMLGRYGRTQDVPIGTAVANRSKTELESLIGCFANTLVLRCGVDPKQSFQELVTHIGNTTLEAFDHADVPFDGVVEAVQPERNLSIPPIFQVMFRLHNQKMGEGIEFSGVHQSLIPISTDNAKLDLNFSLAESERGIEGVIEYATDLFSPETIQRMINHYCTILESAMVHYKQPVEQLSMLSREEIAQVDSWNDTESAYPEDECLHHLFEQTVERYPNKLAYVCGDDEFTYTELNVRANRLAHFLQSRGVTAETRVAVSVERSTWAGISALGIFKAGGTYVPLDANYPKERLNHMLDVAKPKVILTVGALADRYSDADAEVICLDTHWDEIKTQSVSNPPSIGASHSAYVLFTSGTTGMPKGILVSHHSFRNLAVSQSELDLLDSNSRVLQFASLSFSIALWGTFMAWTSGGTLFSVTKEEALPGEPLYNVLNKRQITHVTWPVSLLSTIDIDRVPMSLHTVISSAEPCNDAVVKRWTQRGCRFMNLYGNSEVCLGSTMYEYHQVGQKLSIGKALPNTRMYLLDDGLQQVPIGVIAEIYTAGVGVSRGYIDNPIANAESFISNPFSNDPTQRLYKTGDLGRYLPNGEIEFVGREDFQVNIRGFRVELVEVENALRDEPGISEVVVVSREDDQGLARLLCFYVLENETGDAHEQEGTDSANNSRNITRSTLRNIVADKLPSYMVPSAFIRLDEMPLTPNRKIDRMALPDIDEAGNDSHEESIEARNSIEHQLVTIWCDVLEREKVGVTDNFFELGGHSLLATQVVSQIKSLFLVDIPLQTLFKQPTIEALAKFIEDADASYVEEPINILVNRDSVPLSFAQERLWFLDRYEENSNFYHMPSVLKIEGALDVPAMERAFSTIVERHEALRTNFININGSAIQKIIPVDEFSWTFQKIKFDESIEANRISADSHIVAELQKPFDLEHDALLRTVLMQLADNEYVLFINMHHIVSDGWSISVLIREIQTLYIAYCGNEDNTGPNNFLEDLPVQYADFSVWQRDYLQGEILQKQSQYWVDNLADCIPLELPLDATRPDNQTYNGDRLHFKLDLETKNRLEELSTQEGTTLFMTMLAAFNVLLYRHSGQTDICVGTPVANRVKTEIEPLIGFFANTLVLRSDLSDNIRFSQLLQQVKHTNLSAQEHQDIPFEKVVDMVVPKRDPSRSPLFQVSFALQKLPGLQKQLADISLENIDIENKTAKFDMSLEFLDVEQGFEAYFEYNTDLFKAETIEFYRDHLLALINSIIIDVDATVDELGLSPVFEYGKDQSWSRFDINHHAYSIVQILLQKELDSVGLTVDDSAVISTDTAEINSRYAVLDGRYNTAPVGTTGRLYLSIPDNLASQLKLPVEHATSRRGLVTLGNGGTPAFNTGFMARTTVDGFELIRSEDRVTLVDNALAYPDRIAQALLSNPTVNDCFVRLLKHQSNGFKIVVYLASSTAINSSELNSWLTNKLSEYDNTETKIPLPYAYVPVTHIPYLKQGGVDKRALSELAVFSDQVLNQWQSTISAIEGVSQTWVTSREITPQQGLVHLSDILPSTNDSYASGVTTRAEVDSGDATQSDLRSDAKVLNDSSSKNLAISYGGEIADLSVVPSNTCRNLSQVILNAATAFGHKPCIFYYADRSEKTITYSELLEKAKAVQTGLMQLGLEPKHKVIFQFDRNEDFVVSFWACVLGGFIPVPIAASRDYSKSNANTAKVAHAYNMMDKAVVLTSDALLSGVNHIAKLENSPAMETASITPMYLLPKAEHQVGVDAASDDITLIMLTSGSTGLPKGVQLSHNNIISRTKGSIQMNGFYSDQVTLNWMALDHVGGIIYFHIRDAFLGAKQLQVDTDYVLAEPLRWLDLINEHQVNVTWAPNFAFALIVDLTETVISRHYDLSCMKFMLNGAEAVVPKTTQAFIELLTPFNLPDDAVKPVYGMSEISSGITYPERMELTYSGDDSVFVSVGKPIPGVNLRIVDAEDNVLREGESGRLQISGLTVTQGYLGGDAINKDAFTSDGWFKTGDLAFLDGGALTITGREKDVIIINGANYYSHEIESVVEEIEHVNVTYTGACAVQRAGHQGDQLAIFFNTDITDNEKLVALISDINQQVMGRIGVRPAFVLPLTKNQIPKTEIGKIQLSKLASSFNKGEFDTVIKRVDILQSNANTLPNWFFEPTWVAKSVKARGLSRVKHPIRESNSVLIFADEVGLHKQINLQGILVKSGKEFKAISDSEYEINSTNRSDYMQLIQALLDTGRSPSHIVNLWGYDLQGTVSHLGEDREVASVYFTAQTLNSLMPENLPQQWLYVSRQSQKVVAEDELSPNKSLVIPLLQAFVKEHANVHCQHLDLSRDINELHSQYVLRELTINTSDNEIAYRDNKRFVSRVERADFNRNVSNSYTIEGDSAFVISGGLGGISVELSTYLLKTYNAKLLLLGRTPLNELSQNKQEQLETLRKLGDVEYASADICNSDTLEQLVDKSESRWRQKLKGVFHLAGLSNTGPIVEQDLSDVKALLSPKVKGTQALYDMVNKRSQTLFVTFASVNGYFPAGGMAAYSSANRYQASFIESVSGNKNVQSFCINWSMWDDTGMGNRYAHLKAASQAMGFDPIPVRQGIYSLMAALNKGLTNVLVGLNSSKSNIYNELCHIPVRLQTATFCVASHQCQDVEPKLTVLPFKDEFGNTVEPQVICRESFPVTDSGDIDQRALFESLEGSNKATQEKVAPRNEIEASLIEIATDVFEITQPIGVKDNFFDVGANSLMIVKFHHEIQEKLSVQFELVELFNSTTVEKVAAFLGQQSKPQEVAQQARSVADDRKAAMQRRRQRGRNRRER